MDATLSLSLGAMKPGPPSTCLGISVIPAKASAELLIKSLLEFSPWFCFLFFIGIEKVFSNCQVSLKIWKVRKQKGILFQWTRKILIYSIDLLKNIIFQLSEIRFLIF